MKKEILEFDFLHSNITINDEKFSVNGREFSFSKIERIFFKLGTHKSVFKKKLLVIEFEELILKIFLVQKLLVGNKFRENSEKFEELLINFYKKNEDRSKFLMQLSGKNGRIFYYSFLILFTISLLSFLILIAISENKINGILTLSIFASVAASIFTIKRTHFSYRADFEVTKDNYKHEIRRFVFNSAN